MIGKLISGFKFKPVEAKKPRVSSGIKRKSNKKVYCLCQVSNEGEYYANVIQRLDNGIKCNVVMPFSKRSYNLKGKTIVFTKNKKAYGQIAAIYRTKQEAEHFPGTDEQYTPFRRRWVYGGYIVTFEGKEYFDVTDTYGNKSAFEYLLGSEEDETNEEE